MNGIIDFIFFLDICISFRTTYLDERTGLEVRQTKLLAISYLKGQFTIDVLATIPFDTLAELILGKAGFFKAFGALKLVRVLRLSRIITYLRSKEEIKALLKLVKLIFYLMLYLHCFACAWWMVIKEKRTWIQKLSDLISLCLDKHLDLHSFLRRHLKLVLHLQSKHNYAVRHKSTRFSCSGDRERLWAKRQNSIARYCRWHFYGRHNQR